MNMQRLLSEQMNTKRQRAVARLVQLHKVEIKVKFIANKRFYDSNEDSGKSWVEGGNGKYFNARCQDDVSMKGEGIYRWIVITWTLIVKPFITKCRFELSYNYRNIQWPSTTTASISVSRNHLKLSMYALTILLVETQAQV